MVFARWQVTIQGHTGAAFDVFLLFFFFQAEDGIRDKLETGVQTCALPIFPPLKYDYVHRLKRERPALVVILNGGLSQAAEIGTHVAAGLDGVMLGRAVYHRPALLGELEQALIDPQWRVPEPQEIVERVVAYAKICARRGIRLHSITRHMHGLMAGREGARAWRRFLSEVAARPEAVPETLYSALPILKQGIAA